IEVAHDARNGQPANKLGDQAIADQIARLDLLENLGIAALYRGRCHVCVKPEGAAADALFDNLFQTDKNTTAYKKDVGGIHGRELLMRVLAAALRRNIRRGAFQYLKQRLLHALAGNVASDGGILVLLGDLVDLVDIDDALLSLLNIALSGLQELQDNVLD